MHPTILVQRRAVALNRITERAAALVKQLRLDPALSEALRPTGAKDPQVTEMFRLEAVANLFDQLAQSAGLPESATVTAVTDEGEVESKPVAESIPGPESLTEELPPPILEEGVSPTDSEELRSSAPEADDQPGPVEAEAAIEELLTEEAVPTEEMSAAEPEAEPEEAPKAAASRKRKSSKKK
jgi:hypothetical protein